MGDVSNCLVCDRVFVSEKFFFECRNCHSQFTNVAEVLFHFSNPDTDDLKCEGHESSSRFKSENDIKQEGVLEAEGSAWNEWADSAKLSGFESELYQDSVSGSNSDTEEEDFDSEDSLITKVRAAQKRRKRIRDGSKLGKKRRTPPTFICGTCGEEFPTCSDVAVHNRQEDTCSTCHKKMRHMDIREHKKVEHNETIEVEFKCDECGKTLSNARCLSNHKRIYHSGLPRKKIKKEPSTNPDVINKEYNCWTCGDKFVGLSKLNIHLMEKEKCNLCDQEVRHKLMRKHMLKMHKIDDDTSKTCETCGKSFKNLMCLKVHVRKYHTEKTVTQCKFCDYKNSEPFYVKVHMKNWHDYGDDVQMLLCLLCGYQTVQKSVLKRHVVTIHGEEHWDSWLKYDWSRHDPTTHIFQVPKHLGNIERKLYGPPPKPERIVCDLCGKSIKRKCYSKHKKEVHNKQSMPLHQCEFCEFKTLDKLRLRRHFDLKHNPNAKKDFICHVCGKAYISKQAVKKHVDKSHGKEYWSSWIPPFIEEKPKPNLKVDFICHICNKSYANRKSVKKHIDNLHGKEHWDSWAPTTTELPPSHHQHQSQPLPLHYHPIAPPASAAGPANHHPLHHDPQEHQLNKLHPHPPTEHEVKPILHHQ